MKAVWDFLASFKLAFVLLIALAWLTWRGTEAQVEMGLFNAQNAYFSSWIVVDQWRPLDLVTLRYPFPGGIPLMGLLTLNLIVGGFVRIRKDSRRAGVLVTHLGILILMAAGLVKFQYSDEGHLTLYEGELADQFESYHHYDVAITRDLGDGRFEEHVIPGEMFVGMGEDGSRTFTSDELPFDVVVSHWMRNAEPRPKGPMFQVSVPVVDGFFLRSVPLREKAETNIPGAYVTLVEEDGGERHQGILWAWSGPSTAAWSPWVAEVGGERWAVELRNRRYDMPFTLQLDDFRAEFHPRTNTPAAFESDVTKVEGDAEHAVLIQMNEPLRHGDYVVFQSGYGPSNAGPGDRMYSTFSVVRNPSDQWPLIGCIVIALGLIFHFGSKLWRYIQSESRRAVA